MIFKKLNCRKKMIVGAKVSYWQHALAYPNHCFRACGGPEAFTSTTIFKKCGVKTCSGGQEIAIDVI